MGYLVCEKCKGYYKLKKGESAEDFSKCDCDGNLKFYNDVVDFIEEKLTLEQRISEYELKFDDLEDFYSNLNTENKVLDDDYSLLNNVMKEKLYEENSKLKIEKIQLNESFSLIKKDYSRLKDEITNLKEIGSNLDGKYSEFESDYEDLKNKYSDLLITEDNLKSENTQLKIENNDLNERISTIEVDNAILINENSKLSEIGSEWEEIYTELESSYINLKSKHSNLIILKDSLDEEHSKFKIENSKLNERISLIKRDNAVLKNENSKLIEISSDLDMKHSKLVLNYENLNNKYSDLLITNKSLDEENSKLMIEKVEWEDKYLALEYSNWDIFFKLESENKSLKDINSLLNSFLKSEYRNLGNNFIRLDESISSINGDKSELEGNTNLKKIISNLEGSYTKFISPYENLKSYFDLVTEEDLTGDDSIRLDESFSYIKWDNSKLKEENRKLKKLNAELNAKYPKFESENINLKKKYSNSKEDESSELKKNKDEFKDSDSDLRDLNSIDNIKNDFITFIYDDIYGSEDNIKNVIELKNQLNNKEIKNSVVHISKLNLKSLKKCTECGRVLPVTKFSKTNSNADEYVEYCNDCDKKNMIGGYPHAIGS